MEARDEAGVALEVVSGKEEARLICLGVLRGHPPGRRALVLDARASEVMPRNSRTVRRDDRLVEAARVLREAQIDQVPVVDARGRAIGYLDVQDLLAARIL